MKHITFNFILLVTSQIVFGQGAKIVLDTSGFRDVLRDTRDKLTQQTNKAGNLVSNYTFRINVRNDFALLLTGDKNKTTVGRYASLAIDEKEQKVNFTPISFFKGNDLVRSNFNHIHSLDISGSINSSKILDFKDRNQVTVGWSYTLILLAGAQFYGVEQTTRKQRKYDPSVYDRLHKKIYDDFIEQIDSIKSVADTIDAMESLGDKKSLKKAYLDKVAEYENKLTSDVWNRKNFLWVKITANALSFDNLSIVASDNPSTNIVPIKKNIYNPSLQVSINYSSSSRKYWSYYVNGWVRGAIKHTLSEISTTSEWNQITSYKDSSFVSNDKKDVYVVATNSIKTKVMPEGGGQLILFFPKRKKRNTAGIDISTSLTGFVSSNERPDGYVNTTEIGLVIPFGDSEGKSTIIVEPFYQVKSFLNYDKDAVEIWGAKFSLPFQNLFN